MTILVPTDFSPNAAKALNYAAELAHLVGAGIIIMHATDLTHASINENVVLPQNPDKEIIGTANDKLEVLQKVTAQISGGHVEHQLYNGFVTDAIEQAARENKADLVIMGTLGDTGLREKLFGSITAKVISHVNTPVLAIPLLYDWEPPENILLAINHIDEAPATFTLLTQLVHKLNANLNITIFTNEDKEGPSEFLQHRRDIELFCKKMQHLHPELKILPIPVYGHDFEDAIKTYIAENDTQMLAMVTHKRSFLESIFNKSMTRKMSYHTDIPLLSIPVH